MLPGNGEVTNSNNAVIESNTEIEKEIEKEIDKDNNISKDIFINKVVSAFLEHFNISSVNRLIQKYSIMLVLVISVF